MAFAATTEWDVRTTGSDANGGGFDIASTGTDRSQQDAAYITFTDLVIDGTTNTKITSAAHPFDSTSPGNIINITGGTGFTVQRIQIVSVSGSTATCDKSVGTLSSTGGTGNLGGALLTLAAVNVLIVTSNIVHVKAGTYTLTANVDIPLASTWIGYSATHNDRGTKPLITTATNSTILIKFDHNLILRNLSLSNTAGTRAVGVFCNNNFTLLTLEECILDGLTYAVLGENGTASACGVFLDAVEIKNCTTGGVFVWFEIHVFGCYIHDNAGTSLNKNSTQNDCFSVTRTILANNAIAINASNAAANGSFTLAECTLANNTGTALTSSGTINGTIANNIFYGNGGWAIDTSVAGVARNNAFGSNSSGNVNGTYHDVGSVTLTADPFTNSGTGDYSLNSTAGGGAACKGTAFQW